ncbi:MAG: hypothetical protein C4522_05755 [Desulfobacteraceae bacterium]|nr:MAG: hypothetical protein C4522_05755 [Desulfobacteraceae bacterium]
MNDENKEINFYNVFIKVFFFQLLIVTIISFLIASVIMLDASIQIKVIIVVGFLLGYLTLLQLENVCHNQCKTIYFLRKIFISVETKRLNPESIEPTWSILQKDLEIEERGKKYSKEFGIIGVNTNFIMWCIVIIWIIGVTYLFVVNWNSIIDTLGQLSTAL